MKTEKYLKEFFLYAGPLYGIETNYEWRTTILTIINKNLPLK